MDSGWHYLRLLSMYLITEINYLQTTDKTDTICSETQVLCTTYDTHHIVRPDKFRKPQICQCRMCLLVC